jgi:hypothetical protein
LKKSIDEMLTELLMTIPVIPSADINRDIAWYKEKTGFDLAFADDMYAVLYRGKLSLHLQWHADTEDDPLLGGSVVRIQVKNITPLFNEFVERGTISNDAFRMKTAWGTYDLNKNAIFVFEDIE